MGKIPESFWSDSASHLMSAMATFLASRKPDYLRRLADELDRHAEKSTDFRAGYLLGLLTASGCPPDAATPPPPTPTPRRQRTRKEFPPAGVLPDPDYTDATGGQYLSQAAFARCLGLHPRHLLRWERQGRLTRYRNIENPRDARIYYDFTVAKAYHAQGIEKGLFPAADPSTVE